VKRFDDISSLPELLYWDSSFAALILFGEPSEPHHAESRDFAQRMEAEQVLPVVSDFVYDEVAFLWVKRELLRVAKPLSVHWQQIKRTQPTEVGKALRAFRPRKDELERLTLKISIPDTITEAAFDLMERYDLLPTDAYHIAVALDAGITAFVALDEDYLRVDGIDVYTCL
jgi:predicted nucleic acid-binding protein